MSRTIFSRSRGKICLAICLLVLFVFSNNIRHLKAEDMIDGIEKFKKAIVHLECAADSKSYEEQSRREKELAQQFRAGKLSKDSYRKNF